MKKKTVWIGAVLVVVLSLLLGAGIFALDRFNGINNARAQVRDQAFAVDTLFSDHLALTKKILTAAESLKETEEYRNLKIPASSLEKTPAQFLVDEKKFEKNLNALLDAINENSTLKQNPDMATLLGQIAGSTQDLNNAKTQYNAAIRLYEKKRTTSPEFVATLLGFESMTPFSNISNTTSQ